MVYYIMRNLTMVGKYRRSYGAKNCKFEQFFNFGVLDQ